MIGTPTSPLLAGNTLFVDAVNGATGAVGNASLPFLTLGAAQAAASSGDLIQVRPGSYTVTAPILKNGVNWDFMAGASVSRTTTTNTDSGILDDAGVSITCTVYGEGVFSLAMNGTNSGNYVGCVNCSNASSNIVIHANSISTAQDATGTSLPTAVKGIAGTLRVSCSKSISSVDNNNSNTTGFALYWEAGTMYVDAPSISGSQSAVAFTNTGSAADNLYVNADELYSTGSVNMGFPTVGVILCYASSNANAAVWIRCGTLKANVGSVYCCVSSDGASNTKVYVQAQKLWGYILAQGGLVYVDSDKIEALANVAGNIPALFVECATGTLRYNIRHHEPKAFTGKAFLVDSGTFIANEIEYTSGSGSDGLSISGGTARLQTPYLSTAANTAGNPITKSGGVLILMAATLVSNGTQDSIAAGTAQNVVAMSSWANNAVNGNVTNTATLGLTVNSTVV